MGPHLDVGFTNHVEVWVLCERWEDDDVGSLVPCHCPQSRDAQRVEIMNICGRRPVLEDRADRVDLIVFRVE